MMDAGIGAAVLSHAILSNVVASQAVTANPAITDAYVALLAQQGW